MWLPSLLFLAVPIYEIARSLTAHTYAHYAFWVHNDTLNGLSWTCFISAAILALMPWSRRAAARHLDKLSHGPLKTHLFWVGSAYLGVLIWFCFIRFCQYRTYLLPVDTSNDIHSAYVFLHHGVLEYPMWGIKVLSIHFSLLTAVFSPVLLLWNNPLSLLFLQNIFICSAPFAMYALVFWMTSSSMAGFAGIVLTLSTPYLYELLTSNLNAFNASLCAFMPWAMFCIYLKRWWWAALFMVLMICEKEQVPFLFVGMGLYAIYAFRDKKPWNWGIGAAICAAAFALWFGEMKLIDHYGLGIGRENPQGGVQNWVMFKSIVPDGVPLERVPYEILGHPFRSLRLIFSSKYRFYPLLRVLFSMGFLCFLAPMQMLPFWTVVFPHVLAYSGGRPAFLDQQPLTYWDFGLHHPSYMFGPLIWATAHGIRVAYQKLSPSQRQSWLLVWVLAFSGFGFKYAHRTLNPNWNIQWFDAAPRVMAQIPPNARIWALEYLIPPIAIRRWIKLILWGPDEPSGYRSLFKPDYVLLDKAFVVYAKPPYRDRMVTFFAVNGYKKIVDDSNLILLESPSPAADPESTPERVELPPPDPKATQLYGNYVMTSPAGSPPPSLPSK